MIFIAIARWSRVVGSLVLLAGISSLLLTSGENPDNSLALASRLLATTDVTGRHPGDDGVGIDVLHHHRPSSDDGPLAHGDTGHDDGPCTDIRPLLDADRLDDEVGLDDGYLDGVGGVLASQHLGPRTEADVLPDRHIA